MTDSILPIEMMPNAQLVQVIGELSDEKRASIRSTLVPSAVAAFDRMIETRTLASLESFVDALDFPRDLMPIMAELGESRAAVIVDLLRTIIDRQEESDPSTIDKGVAAAVAAFTPSTRERMPEHCRAPFDRLVAHPSRGRLCALLDAAGDRESMAAIVEALGPVGRAAQDAIYALAIDREVRPRTHIAHVFLLTCWVGAALVRGPTADARVRDVIGALGPARLRKLLQERPDDEYSQLVALLAATADLRIYRCVFGDGALEGAIERMGGISALLRARMEGLVDEAHALYPKFGS